MTAALVTFQTLPIWIQIWGLPFDLLTEETGRDIRNGIGKVVEIDATTFTTDQARILGHEAKDCSTPRASGQVKTPYGEWLKAG
nr:hypothetical protein CFP56_50124 [Quercus suber]